MVCWLTPKETWGKNYLLPKILGKRHIPYSYICLWFICMSILMFVYGCTICIHICDHVDIHISVSSVWSQKQGTWGALRSWKWDRFFISYGWRNIHQVGQCFAQLINIELRPRKIVFFLFCLNQCVICWQKIFTCLASMLPHSTSS